MGKIKYTQEFRDHFKDRNYFTINEAERFLMQKGASKAYVRLMLHQMEKRSGIKRLKRGFYSFSENLDAVGFLFEPFYYGLQEALSLRELWEQQTNPVIITTRRVRTGLRSILGRNVVVRHIKKEMFFGYEPKRMGNAFLPVSDIEKTLIDFGYFRLQIPLYVVKSIVKRLDKDRLNDYLKRTDKSTKKRVDKMLRSAGWSK